MPLTQVTKQLREALCICVRCGMEPALLGYKKCQQCTKLHREYNQRYRKVDSYRQRMKELRAKFPSIRQAVIAELGGACVKCGFSDYRALQFDHVNGDGFKEGRLQFTSISKILKRVERGELQLLCANCNWIKRAENNEVGNAR